MIRNFFINEKYTKNEIVKNYSYVYFEDFLPTSTNLFQVINIQFNTVTLGLNSEIFIYLNHRSYLKNQHIK